MKERPSLHALEAFLAVIEHGTMLAAAEAEAISQPAISAHVKSLEGYFGTPLLERTGRRVRPTPAGELVALQTRRLLGLVDELGQALDDIAGLRRGRLVVGASATVGETWLPAVLGRFQADHPAVEIVTRLGNSEVMIQAVRDRVIGFAVIGRADQTADLIVRAVFDDRLALFAASASPLAGRAALRVRDLAGETFVLREPGSATRETALRGLAAHGLTPAKVLELGSNEAVKRAVAAGLGIGILSSLTLDVDQKAGAIVLLTCADWVCQRQFWLVYRRDRVLSHAEQAFLALLPHVTPDPAAAR
ncbi:MAG: LysR family transcriptional regulator [Chloroflexi bacterium]|nr:LysR family transcriptional regulator [Chloroflexota bacterium]